MLGSKMTSIFVKGKKKTDFNLCSKLFTSPMSVGSRCIWSVQRLVKCLLHQVSNLIGTSGV